MKRVFIVHGWKSTPEDCWFPWLKQELEKQGLEVFVPAMPEALTPKVEVWVPYLSQLVGTPDAETYFVGHSVGVQTILRYVETLDACIGGMVLVAGFFKLSSFMDQLVRMADGGRSWLTLPIDTNLIQQKTKNIIAIFSDNDRFVPLENVELFQTRLHAKVVVLPHRGHLGPFDHAETVPEILEATLKVLKEEKDTISV